MRGAQCPQQGNLQFGFGDRGLLQETLIRGEPTDQPLGSPGRPLGRPKGGQKS